MGCGASVRKDPEKVSLLTPKTSSSGAPEPPSSGSASLSEEELSSREKLVFTQPSLPKLPPGTHLVPRKIVANAPRPHARRIPESDQDHEARSISVSQDPRLGQHPMQPPPSVFVNGVYVPVASTSQTSLPQQQSSAGSQQSNSSQLQNEQQDDEEQRPKASGVFNNFTAAMEVPDEVASLDLNGQSINTVPPCICGFLFLRRLNLQRNNLQKLPDSFRYLGNLRRLDVGNNNLSLVVEMPKIQQLSRLKSLSWSNNACSVIPHKGWSSLRMLRTLNISHNGIRELSSPDFMYDIWQLTALTSLDISFNNLSILPEELGNLCMLKSLYARNNTLFRLPLRLVKLSSLQTLDLVYNHLLKFPHDLVALSALKRFGVSTENSLTCVGLEQFTCLEELHLVGTRISTIPASFSLLSSLRILDLYRNNLLVLPQVLSSLNLDALSVGHNKLNSLSPLLPRLVSLRHLSFCNDENEQQLGLDINCNQITHLTDDIGRLSKLESLSCNYNPIKQFPPGVSLLINLTDLRARSCSLQAHGLKFLHLLPSLRYLDLGNASTEQDNINSFGTFPELEFPQLEELHMHSANLRHIPWNCLAKLTRLRVIDFSQNQIITIHESVSAISCLEHFNLSGNELRDIPVELARLSNLLSLSLSDNMLHTVPSQLTALRKLTHLALGNNLFSQQEVDEIRKAFGHINHLEISIRSDGGTRTWMLRKDRVRTKDHTALPPIRQRSNQDDNAEEEP